MIKFDMFSRIILQLCAFLFMIPCVSCSIEHENNNTSKKDAFDLNDVWVRTSSSREDEIEIEIEIKGNSGYFLNIYHGDWQVALDSGLIKLGDEKLKNIKRVDKLNWTCDDRWVYYDTETGMLGDPAKGFDKIGWEENCLLAMSEDGQSISVDLKEFKIHSYIFTRKSQRK